MMDVALTLSVTDGHRRFDLNASFCTDAPVVALYGPSGSGKSLTLQAMAGLIRPGAGHVRVAGRTLFDSRAGIDIAPEHRGLGYLFQHYALFPHLSVRENIAFGLTNWRKRLQPTDAQQVDELIESFGLQAMAASRPSTLSGGQQQRVALARALACKPQLLLLDEPFAALNPMLRQQLREELATVRKRFNIPAVMITHDVEDVLALADMAYLFEGGHDRGQLVRELDLNRAESRWLARRELFPPARHIERAKRPHEDRLRALLTGCAGAPPAG